MTDHHFSYPTVVPLRGVTISGHSAGTLRAERPEGMVTPHRPVAPALTSGTTAAARLEH
jgi:hypothetical protein